MKKNLYCTAVVGMMLPGVTFAGGMSIDPSFQSFNQVLLGLKSTAQTLTVRNEGATSVTLGSGTLGGPAAGEFLVTSDGCSGRSLAAGASCAVQVKFAPQGRGAKAATWNISMSGGETGTLSSLLANYEDAGQEAQRRIPPVMVDVTLPATVAAGTGSDIIWDLEGYHGDYRAMVVLFDCQGVASECGANYSDPTRFAESALLAPESTSAGSWNFRGNTTQRFRFRYTFTPDATRFASGGQVVARFYYKSTDDLDKGSLSLLVPGGLPNITYYDAEGRRLSLTVTP